MRGRTQVAVVLPTSMVAFVIRLVAATPRTWQVSFFKAHTVVVAGIAVLKLFLGNRRV